jgi:uncharacterized protein YbcC (UPF0753/DUF2309 family)
MVASVLHQQIEEAVEPVSQFWPMKAFVHHNPIHGLEHLPFDEAIREAKHLFGADGYLPNEEYRGFLQSGRIAQRSVDRALARLGPGSEESVKLASQTIKAADVHKLHLIHGIEALDPALLDWSLTAGGALAGPRAAGASTRIDLSNAWKHALKVLGLDDPRAEDAAHGADSAGQRVIELPYRRTVSDWIDEQTGSNIVVTINEQIIKWVASFVDEGMAGWEMPSKRSGFYSAWRELAAYDASGRFLGIKRFAEKVSALPADPEAAISASLEALEIPEERRSEYLTRVLGQLSGWTGFVRWRGLNPEDPIQKECPIDIVQYLGVRLFYEVELAEVEAHRQWGVHGKLSAIAGCLAEHDGVSTGHADSNTLAVSRDAWRLFHLLQFLELPSDALQSITKETAIKLLGWIDAFPPEKHAPVWLEAFEDTYRDEILSRIAGHRDAVAETKTRPLAQVAFCIDVRSEPFRRHFEQAGSFETFGYAGFFGIPMSHRGYDTAESLALCPVLLTPAKAVYELPRAGHQEALERYAAGSRWKQFGDHLFHDLKHNPIASFLLVDVLGLFFSAGLIGKTLLRRPYTAILGAVRRWFVQSVPTQINVGDESGEPTGLPGEPIALPRGFSVDEQATFVENGLRTIGLIENFARFIVLCGHGSASDNNPYYAALDCGACGGRPGDPNARAFSEMGNNPNVRAELARRGLAIPDDTWFLPARHNTSTDRVDVYDLVDVPASHADDLQLLRKGFEDGGRQQALDRCGRIPGAPRGQSADQAYAHVEARSYDWANPRPEWGLAGNAAFIIGRRSLTKGLDLRGRSFLHSYDYRTDPEGAILERIMTAPLVVGEWINMEHYFSATDPWNYGSGSKVIHNVVSGVGLMYGAQSDLATGLPLQTVNNGEIHHHEPMRLLTIIEAEPSVIAAIISRHDVLQQFFHNEWVNLVALDSRSFEYLRYRRDTTWEPIEL